MSSTTLLRLSGLALLLAGVLLAIAIPFHPSDTDPQALVRPAWVPVHTVFTIAVLLSLFGLPGLYLRVQGKSGWLGLLGAILRTRTATSVGGLLFLAGIPLAYWPPLPQLVGTIGGMLLGIGYIWFGYILLTRSSERAVQAQATA